MVTTLALPAGVVGRTMRHHMTMVQTVDTTPAAVDVALPLCCSIAHKHSNDAVGDRRSCTVDSPLGEEQTCCRH